MGNRGAWIIAGAILLAAIAIGGVLLSARAEDRACREWQAEFQEKAAQFAIPANTNYRGEFEPGNDGRLLAQLLLSKKQPEGCPQP